MAEKIISKRTTQECFCAHCLYKILAPRGKKETPEAKLKRIAQNEERTLVYRVITEDGKVISAEGYYPYYYEKRPHHRECLDAYLKEKCKGDEIKKNALFEKAVANHDKHIEDSRKKGLLKAKEMENAKQDRTGRERLINYLKGHYGVSIIPKKVQTDLKNLHEGKSAQYEGLIISYDKMLDMFLYYENDLLGIYRSKLKKGKAPESSVQRLMYDLSVVIVNIDDYDSRKQINYIQQDERTEEELLDVKKYNQVTNTKPINTVSEEIENAERFADELTRDLDEEDDSFIASLFKDND